MTLFPSLTFSLAIIAFFCCSSHVLSLASCDSDRPGSESHRTLTMPASMMTGSYEEESWAKALCCVYTHVTESSSVSSPLFELYDGSSYDLTGDTSVEVLKEAMDETCDMYMGKEDCANKAECVNNALNSGCVDSPLAMLINGKMRVCAFAKLKYWSKRCGRRSIASHCPKTCDYISSSCNEFMGQDSKKRFKMTVSGFEKSCKWVGRNGVEKTKKRCAKYGVATTCRKTCREYI